MNNNNDNLVVLQRGTSYSDSISGKQLFVDFSRLPVGHWSFGPTLVVSGMVTSLMLKLSPYPNFSRTYHYGDTVIA